MNKFVAICFFTAMTLGINAYRLNEADPKYIECAAKKWSVVFVDFTYVKDTKACLTGIQDNNVIQALQIINANEVHIESNQKYYENTADSVEKYDLLYHIADRFREENEKVRQLVADLSQEVQDCVAVQLEKATKRVEAASDCKQLRQAE